MKPNAPSKILRTVSQREAFMFYTDIHQYTGKLAYNITDFLDELKSIQLQSLEFHFKRGDFQKWFEDTLGDISLANNITQVDKTIHGEELRNTLDKLVNQRLNQLQTSTTNKLVEPPKQHQANHEKLIKAMIRHLQDNEKFTMVKGNIEGYESSEKINGYKPDILAIKVDEKCLVEAETCDTLMNPQTDDRWRAFARAALRPDTRFDIIIPKKCEAQAIEKRRKLGIKAKIWQISL